MVALCFFLLLAVLITVSAVIGNLLLTIDEENNTDDQSGLEWNNITTEFIDEDLTTTELPTPISNCLVGRSFWTPSPPRGAVAPVTSQPLSLVVILHTVSGSCHQSQDCKAEIKFIQDSHFKRGFADIGYNFLVGGDGFVYVGRGWGQIGAHTYGYNSISVGIAFMGLYHNTFPKYDVPTANQIRCTRYLLAQGVKLGYLAEDYKLAGYCDLKPGIPPGNVLMKELRTWPHYIASGNESKCEDPLQ